MKFFTNMFVKTCADCMKTFYKTIKDLETMIEQRSHMMDDLQIKIDTLDKLYLNHEEEIDKATNCVTKINTFLEGKDKKIGFVE